MPFADVGPTIIPEWMSDEDAVMLTDALPTGYFGAQLGEIVEGDVVVVFGVGPVGLFRRQIGVVDGPARVTVINHLDYRLERARDFRHAETYNFTQYADIVVEMKKARGHLGADRATADDPGPERLGDGTAGRRRGACAGSGDHPPRRHSVRSAAQLAGSGQPSRSSPSPMTTPGGRPGRWSSPPSTSPPGRS